MLKSLLYILLCYSDKKCAQMLKVYIIITALNVLENFVKIFLSVNLLSFNFEIYIIIIILLEFAVKSTECIAINVSGIIMYAYYTYNDIYFINFYKIVRGERIYESRKIKYK